MDPTYEATLSVLDGPAAGLVIPIHRPWGNVSIGSDPACSVVIPLPGVRAIHARLWIDDGSVTLYSNAAEGFEVNGRVVDAEMVLRHGDVLALRGRDGESVAFEYREPVRAQSVAAGAVAVGGGATVPLLPVEPEEPRPAPRPLVLLDPAAPLARPFVPASPLQRVVRDVLQVSFLARTALAWRMAQARSAARRQVRQARAQVAAAGARIAPCRPSFPSTVARGSRAHKAPAVRQSWWVRVAAAFRLMVLKLRGEAHPAPALRVVGGTQHRPVPGARRAAAARSGSRFAYFGVVVAVLMLGLAFFRPAVRGMQETLAVPAVAAATGAAVVHAAPATPRPAAKDRPRPVRRAVKRASLEQPAVGVPIAD